MKHVKNCLPSQSLIMLYRMLVELYFRCCSTTWGKCGHTLPDKLQTLQDRASEESNLKKQIITSFSDLLGG